MDQLFATLGRLAQLQGDPVDRLALAEASAEAVNRKGGWEQLLTLSQRLHLKKPRTQKAPDPAALPALIFEDGQWRILRGQNGLGQWVASAFDVSEQRWVEGVWEFTGSARLFRISLSRPFVASRSPIYRIIRDEVFSRWRDLSEIMLATVLINLIAIATSFYSMQVYDRVVPTGASQTLLVLSTGVMLAILFELASKYARANAYERLVDLVDSQLSRSIFVRFLGIRLDQLPRSVGSLANQLRGYEAVRGFLTSVAAYVLVDAPFAIFFIAIIAFIGGWLAAIPVAMFILSLSVGLFYRKRMDALAAKSTAASNLKNGLLVEAIEGAETIKSGQGGWRLLSRWIGVTDEARTSELEIRNVSEHAMFITGALQQVCYTLMIACGALLVSKGQITLGSLIACSILAGRVLTPVAAIPSQLVQWSHARAALQGLDRLWQLKDDHDGHEQPLILPVIHGDYQLQAVRADYGDRPALTIDQLKIGPGERIGIIGPVGAGKTTFLRLLSGMYKPQTGRIFLDSVDIDQISKPVLAEHVGYLQQEGRLFAGTLRDNLILGLLDPGDEVVLKAAQKTGLFDSVVRTHPKGIQQPIYEGGLGLSGGQRQLVNLTRLFLRQPHVWLLDEPTASVDRVLESQIISTIQNEMRPTDTLVLVTHKPEMLGLVNRLIVVSAHRVVMDGPRDSVLARLQSPSIQAGAA